MSSGSRAALIALTLLLATAGLATGTVLAGQSQDAVPPGPEAGFDSSASVSSDSTTASVPALTSARSPTTTTGPSPALASSSSENGTIVFDVQLRENGDARWRMTVYYNLTTANETRAFEETAAQFEAGEASPLGLPTFRRAQEAVDSRTDRRMRIRDTNWSSAPESQVANGTGWLRLSFVWTNFARTADDRLVVGDVFEIGEDDVWFPELDANHTLRMHAPEGGAVVNANTDVSESTLTWEGPTPLDRTDLSATFTVSGGGPAGGNSEWTMWALAIAGVAIVVVLVGIYLLARRRGGVDLPSGLPDASLDGLRSNGEADGTSSAAENGAASSDGPAAGNGAGDGDVDLELLSDEERVERLLEHNGGRMKQATIVKETGWSNAKVSQLLSAMEDEDRIDKLRIGRENLISFPDEDLTDIEE